MAKQSCVLHLFTPVKKSKFESLLCSAAAFLWITDLNCYTSGTETQWWDNSGLNGLALLGPSLSLLPTADSRKLNCFGWCHCLLCHSYIICAWNFICSKSEGWNTLALPCTHKWLHTSSEDFLKSESYRKQTDLYLHGSMSEIPKIRATFSEPLSSNLNSTDQSEFLARQLRIEHCLGKPWHLQIIYLQEKEANKDFPLRRSPMCNGHHNMMGLKSLQNEPWFQRRQVTWTKETNVR